MAASLVGSKGRPETLPRCTPAPTSPPSCTHCALTLHRCIDLWRRESVGMGRGVCVYVCVCVIPDHQGPCTAPVLPLGCPSLAQQQQIWGFPSEMGQQRGGRWGQRIGRKG